MKYFVLDLYSKPCECSFDTFLNVLLDHSYESVRLNDHIVGFWIEKKLVAFCIG